MNRLLLLIPLCLAAGPAAAEEVEWLRHGWAPGKTGYALRESVPGRRVVGFCFTRDDPPPCADSPH